MNGTCSIFVPFSEWKILYSNSAFISNRNVSYNIGHDVMCVEHYWVRWPTACGCVCNAYVVIQTTNDDDVINPSQRITTLTIHWYIFYLLLIQMRALNFQMRNVTYFVINFINFFFLLPLLLFHDMRWVRKIQNSFNKIQFNW